MKFCSKCGKELDKQVNAPIKLLTVILMLSLLVGCCSFVSCGESRIEKAMTKASEKIDMISQTDIVYKAYCTGEGAREKVEDGYNYYYIVSCVMPRIPQNTAYYDAVEAMVCRDVCDGVVEALKPILKDLDITLIIEVYDSNGRFYKDEEHTEW